MEHLYLSLFPSTAHLSPPLLLLAVIGWSYLWIDFFHALIIPSHWRRLQEVESNHHNLSEILHRCYVVKLLLDRGQTLIETPLHWAASKFLPNIRRRSIGTVPCLTGDYTGMSKKMSARLRELATELGARSRNLANIFLDIPV